MCKYLPGKRISLLVPWENFLDAGYPRSSTEETIVGSYENGALGREIFVVRGTMDVGIELSHMATYDKLALRLANVPWSEDSGLLPGEKGQSS